MTQKTFLKIDEKLYKKFIKLVKGGMTKPEACEAINVGASTMRRYEHQLRNDVNYTGELAPLNNGLTKTFREKQKAMTKKTAKTTVKKETVKTDDIKTTVKKPVVAKKTTTKPKAEKKPTQKELDKIYAKVKVKDTTKKDVSKTTETKPTSKATKPVETVTETKPTQQESNHTDQTKPKSTEAEVKKKNSRQSKK